VYKIQIDQSLCSGFGTCAELAPEIFELDGSTATVRRGESDDPNVLEAASACPMAAITISEQEAA
jgi:ferredoxin